MGRKAKCKICGTELSKDRYSPNGKAPYYCSEGEYLSTYKNTDKDELYALIQQIFSFKDNFIPPLVKKLIKDLTNTYDYGIIKECFKEQRKCIEYYISIKQFENTSHMIRYVFAIIKNTIADVKPKEDRVVPEDNTDVELLNNIKSCSRVKDISRWL